MKYLIIGVVVVLVLFLLFNNRENFSKSGLAMTDEDCDKLAYVYTDNDKKLICDKSRRKTLDHSTGNYYSVYGELV